MTTVRLYNTGYSEARTYFVSALFVLGNLVLPQIFHLVPDGGKMWLPIYFFTLIGAYKYGWKTGLLIATLSPCINSLLFGMPMREVLPAILLKSVLLAVAAGYVAQRYEKVSIGLLLCTVLFYQIVGTLGEWCMNRDLYLAIQDFRIGIPGMALQVAGGFYFIKYILKK